ncbi:C2 domain protein [Ancylostoma caninum]|uniref:C2 domain protein n=1 Tax=Ancylostoma caninum TaxID=29170 RepID=A0A368EZ71_ANCCA|nr:C2 domain protein [Ancylostoma caninum]
MDDRSVLHYELGFYEKSGDNCYRGTLTFALRYDFIHRVLMLHVLRANHLPVEEKGRTVDPYVKMYLLPERRNHCKTRICKKTLDPDFNEMFSFDVAFNSLSGRMLQVRHLYRCSLDFESKFVEQKDEKLKDGLSSEEKLC